MTQGIKNRVTLTHFEKLLEHVNNSLKPITVAAEYKDGGVYMYLEPVDEVPVRRIAFISDIDKTGKFRVSISKIASEFEYEIEKSTFEINSEYDPKSPHYEVTPTDMSYFYRRLKCFFTERIDLKLIPPIELIKKRNLINEQWMTRNEATVNLYLQDKHDGDWRFKIVHNSGTTIVAHLDTSVTGHTCNMFVSAASEAFKRGLLEGRISYAEEVALDALQRARNGLESYYVEAYAPETHQVIRSGTFRKNKQSI